MDVRTICLGILTRQDATGYEIQKNFKEGWFSAFFSASFGSIYPALSKLTEDGFVTCREVTEDPGPAKKIYSITSKGNAEFRRLLAGPVGEEKFRSPLMATLMFGHMLPPERVTALIDDYISHLDEDIDKMASLDGSLATPGELFIAGYGRAFHKMARDYFAQNRHLIEDSVNGREAAE